MTLTHSRRHTPPGEGGPVPAVISSHLTIIKAD